MISSRRSSAAVCGSLRMPRSSTMSSATATRSSKYCLRVPSSEAIGQLFDQDMRLSIDDAVALLDRSAADGLGEMTLARARRTEQQHVFALTDKTRGCEIVDERAIHLLVEIEIKASRARSASRKAASLRRRAKRRSCRRSSSSDTSVETRSIGEIGRAHV